tara:strand:+ start:629 stop:1072 length:444 start_codon:yes stop_codon:yes gene_type:complete
MSNYKKAYMKTRIQKTTYMTHDVEGLCTFEIHGGDYSENIETFQKGYVEERKEMFEDMGWGEWSEGGDMGYQNYLEVLESGDYKLGYYENEFSYRVPAQIKCCGKWMSLGKFTNTCKCGADYNGSGQLLASRSHWGEETGEHWSECL